MPRLTKRQRKINTLEREKDNRVELFKQLEAHVNLADTIGPHNSLLCGVGDDLLYCLINRIYDRFVGDIRDLRLIREGADAKANEELQELRNNG